jgi:hypothetical protein
MSGQERNVLNPWFFSGFTDAEGCFSIGIRPDAKLKIKLTFAFAIQRQKGFYLFL